MSRIYEYLSVITVELGIIAGTLIALAGIAGAAWNRGRR